MNEQLIECIGVDGKKHVCKPESNKTACGIKIARKTLGKTDHERYGCYPCTY